MSRAHLPNRREGEAIDFSRPAMKFVFTVAFSCFPDGRPAEIFLNVAPSGGELEKSIRDAAIVASFALQHGADVNRLVEAVTHEEDGDASSILGQALMLVRAAIQPNNPPAPDAPAPEIPGGPAGAGDGGGAAEQGRPDGRAPEATPVAPNLVLDPADPKELQNDGEPIREAVMP